MQAQDDYLPAVNGNSSGQNPFDNTGAGASTSPFSTAGSATNGASGTNPVGAGQLPANTTPPEDLTPANFQLGVKFVTPFRLKFPPHSLSFDEEYFMRLLAGSISLSREEKRKIIESVPKLVQNQIDELTRIFEEEKEKFSMLSKKHLPMLEKLAEQHYLDWLSLEDEATAQERKNEALSQADEIRKQLGL